MLQELKKRKMDLTQRMNHLLHEGDPKSRKERQNIAEEIKEIEEKINRLK